MAQGKHLTSGTFDHTLLNFADKMTQGLNRLGFEVRRPDWVIDAEPTVSEIGTGLA